MERQISDPVRDYHDKLEQMDLSWLEVEEEQKEAAKLEYERLTILSGLNDRMKKFDNELWDLRSERAELAVELKAMELEEIQMLAMYEILEEFQSKGEKLKN